jgi:hypothetical protein
LSGSVYILTPRNLRLWEDKAPPIELFLCGVEATRVAVAVDAVGPLFSNDP